MPVIDYVTPASIETWLIGRIGRRPDADAPAAEQRHYYQRRAQACSDVADRSIGLAEWHSDNGRHEAAQNAHRRACEHLSEITYCERQLSAIAPD